MKVIFLFFTVLDFLRWKDEFERQEKSRFVKKSGSRLREEGIRVGYYYCNRSGTYVSQSKGMKNPKKKGTAKTNNHCTASITCFELPNGKLDVKICSTHYGHESELQHLRLTQTEKFQIAEQLCRGVPREMVLDSVRASTGSDIERIHLITIKDVKNIEKAYGIQANTNEKTTNMYYNLTDWISNIMASDNGPVLYFKEEGTLNCKDHDITLILLTKGQIEVLKKYSINGVFYISTFITKSKNVPYYQNFYIRPTLMNVITLMLLDDLNEAVPVSFMLTHDLNSKKFKIFFESLKKRVPQMSASAVFTDDKNEIFETWCSVFQQEPLHFWSNRFVDSDWRENLAYITDEELQVSIYEKLYSFLELNDAEKLESQLASYISDLQTGVVTSKFGNYFSSKYIGTEVMWAGCFGKQSVGINAQLKMEVTHNEIEEITNKKHWDRNFLVRIVQHLLKSVSEKQCVRQSKLQRQIQELPSHHKLALNVKPESIHQESDSCWRVESAKDPVNIFSHVSCQSYLYCDDTVCALSCAKCNVCAHQFKCSCKVYMFDRTMCKHIHAVALFVAPKSVATSIKEEPPTTDKENKVDKPKLCLYSEWHLCKRGRKKKVKDPIKEENINDVIEYVVKTTEENKISVRRSKRIAEKVQSTEKNDELEVTGTKTRRKSETDSEEETDEEDHSDSSSVRPHRANILRKSK